MVYKYIMLIKQSNYIYIYILGFLLAAYIKVIVTAHNLQFKVTFVRCLKKKKEYNTCIWFILILYIFGGTDQCYWKMSIFLM